MRTLLVAFVVAAALAGGCRLYFWAGEHELTVPPRPETEATPTPGP